MKVIMRGMMVHILLHEEGEIAEIFQDTLIQPPEKFNIEIHLDKNHKIISLILLDVGTNTCELIIKELAKQEPLYQKNLFRFDIE
jgi:hypothetical protein